ncbi:hypothetical protein NQ315_017364 [Exocentrus adspersus]|uniref:Uncharacterized protein n=1 Tax=Exocentrus adspersus TaxID=1586481 RepID=A0AAV8VKH6_9CUCU|nr:hypothetical protein NQ315_017364 [Exocentrus adspersus]
MILTIDELAHETESWHLLSAASNKPNDHYPPPRHKHSAILHANAMWVYGGMTDLQERGDLWRWDAVERTWHCIKIKVGPGPLHSHAACKMSSCMVIFGGISFFRDFGHYLIPEGLNCIGAVLIIPPLGRPPWVIVIGIVLAFIPGPGIPFSVLHCIIDRAKSYRKDPLEKTVCS